jgi:malonyl-CoA/methylmalonyl-CoA synthetase
MNRSLFAAIATAHHDERPALLTHDGRSFSYAALIAYSGQVAHQLVGAGIKPGDRVAVQVEKSAEALLVYLACLRTGAVYLPLNVAYTPTEVAYFLADAEPALFIVDPSAEQKGTQLATAIGGRVLTLSADGREGSLVDGLDRLPAAFEDVARTGSDLAAILYTSGTTGRSKGAMLSHDNLRSNARSLVEAWRFTPDDVLLHALPIYHTHGLFVGINVTLLAGASMIVLPKFDPDSIFGNLPEANVLMGVPTFYTRLLADPRLSRDAVRHMRLFVSGSAPLLADTHRAWQEKTGHRILERYGMTETNMITSNPYEGERRPGTVGPPLSGVEARVVDMESGAPLSAGRIGMIEVRGPNVFSGYWGMPEKTASEFRSDDFFITGDLGRFDEDGYLEIVGRGKDLVITGGFNVYPKEVEMEIDAVEGVYESAVVGIAHPDLGEGVTALVRLEVGAQISESQIMVHLGERLASFKLPKRILFIDELPRNTMGKVQKALLREQLSGLYS